ncbi:hypothetical protein Bfae_08730 [Brachybacterium faecium DSM 4810]|uniref:Uncharacterized protein n=1 Tax=Brachybacterium faecium (strain ATCC 43885 / DSM 4810 / JCM 11609 / LMG 19847 / NBRC 14762 / NCIMB 9860 / 6-10) TaxID=446465 RepID=C7MAG9_BRAFD|nr:hypothetical protein [Brachybacterium faecium]ACU84727.1 hypothetical protein Bfae_08730 [Brachybacterium faecium DSM 4810]HJG52478.1 hypothetical protein [Brachybacterium faecium]
MSSARVPLARASGPSSLLPVLVAVAGTALAALELAEVLRASPAAGQARPMSALVLTAALALGGFSLTRVLQLLVLATARARRRAAGAALDEVPWQLPDAHSLHAIWVIGVGASVALMGLLGLWSLADGRPSGLEPGWPLLLAGGAVALGVHLLRVQISACWRAAGGPRMSRRPAPGQRPG